MSQQGIFPLRVDSYPRQNTVKPDKDEKAPPPEGEDSEGEIHGDYEILKRKLNEANTALASAKKNYEKKLAEIKSEGERADSVDWKRAVVLSEILDKPRCKRNKK